MALARTYQRWKNGYHFLQAHAWRLWYGMPDRGMKLYGVTGTNGKTTTCYLLAGILAAARGNDKVGMLTTVAFRIGTKEEWNETKLTTLPSKLVYAYLKKMKQARVSHVVLEMTSHALDQGRLAGLKLDGAIILNISPEHLNYHGTVEALAAAKGKIVQYLQPHAPLVANRDDANVHKLLNALPTARHPLRVIWFTRRQAVDIETKLEGSVNKENALAASLLAKAVDIQPYDIKTGIASVARVPGRMEWVKAPKFRILIDYAVTPDALERLYSHVRRIAQGRVLALLGAAGLRDRSKRPEMARTVRRHADTLVITREDPWTEDEEQIFQDLEAGLDSVEQGKIWRRIIDRKQALQFLLKQARPGDIVVVTGKGAETGMGIGTKIVPYNERQVIEEILRELP